MLPARLNAGPGTPEALTGCKVGVANRPAGGYRSAPSV